MCLIEISLCAILLMLTVCVSVAWYHRSQPSDLHTMSVIDPVQAAEAATTLNTALTNLAPGREVRLRLYTSQIRTVTVRNTS